MEKSMALPVRCRELATPPTARLWAGQRRVLLGIMGLPAAARTLSARRMSFSLGSVGKPPQRPQEQAMKGSERVK